MAEAAESGIDVQQVGLAGVGAIFIGLAIRWMAGLAQRDADERVELRKLPGKVAELEGKWAACEAHREHMVLDFKRLDAELQDIKQRQGHGL